MATPKRADQPTKLRTALAVLRWLLLGAAVNVGVVWGWRTANLPDPVLTREMEHAVVAPWPIPLPDWWPATASTRRWEHRLLISRGRFTAAAGVNDDGSWQSKTATEDFQTFEVMPDRCGLPFRALELWTVHHVLIAKDTSAETNRLYTHHDLRFTWFGRQVTLPKRVLPAGFAANTLIYAALAWATWRIPGLLRRRRRHRRGQCITCGYDRQGAAADAACPECGRAHAAC